MIAALAYPALLTVVAVAVVIGLMAYVVPEVISVFQRFHTELPWPTQVLIALSAVIRAAGGWLLVGAIVMATACVAAWRVPTLRAAWQSLALRLPGVGPLLRAIDIARFSRTLALLTSSAVPLLEALNIATRVVERAPLRAALARAAVRVREGQGFAAALAQTRQFPPVVVRLIASGERAGRLDAMLFEAAEHQERELDSALAVVTAILGPGVILLVGGLVLFIVLAILLPIFQINTLIQ